MGNFFMAVLFTLRVFARNLLRGSCRRNIFHISNFDNWPGIGILAFESNKSKHYILDHQSVRCSLVIRYVGLPSHHKSFNFSTRIHTHIIGH